MYCILINYSLYCSEMVRKILLFSLLFLLSQNLYTQEWRPLHKGEFSGIIEKIFIIEEDVFLPYISASLGYRFAL